MKKGQKCGRVPHLVQLFAKNRVFGMKRYKELMFDSEKSF